MSEIENIKHKVSLDLISGSGDLLRSAFGGSYKEISSSEGESLEFRPYMAKNPESIFFDSTKYKSSEDYVQPIDTTTLMPNKKFPIRIYGDHNNVKDDRHWYTIFYGGTHSGSKYQAKYNTNRYEKIDYRRSGYDSFPNHRLLEEAGLTSKKATCSYKINRYNKHYYSFANSIQSEMLLPNCYFLSDMSTYDIYDEDSSKFNASLIKLVTCDNTYEDVGSLFTLNIRSMRADLSTNPSPKKLEMITKSKKAYEYSFLNTTYMTAALPQCNFATEMSKWPRTHQRNILFDIDAVDKFYKTLQVSENMEYFPYYININFSPDDVGQHYESIKNNNFSSMFIKTLFAVFTDYGRKDIQLSPTYQDIASSNDNYQYYDNNGTATAFFERTLRRDTEKYYDYLAFLEYCKNYTINGPGLPGYMFAGETNAYRNAASLQYAPKDESISNANRYIKSSTSNNTIFDLITMISSSDNSSAPSLDDLYDNTESETETIAYRIEKSSTSPRADQSTIGTEGFIQNYWFMNTDMQEFNFYDTQVKYNVNYQYKLYAYKIVKGLSYRYSNLLLSRQLNCDLENTYGLEFYDPSTKQRAEQLFETEGGRIQRLNDYATMAQVTSEYPFLADMYVETETFVRICEELVFTKNVTIVDHPPPKVFARPYQTLDASKKIGFELRLLGHEDAVYQRVFEEQQYIDINDYDYNQSNNLLETDKVTDKSVSQVRTIDIYRTTTKPTSLLDFEGRLITTLDLSIPNSQYGYKTNFFENIIDTNQKYYYVFRARNVLNTPGHFSDIYEVELVDDGGYIYNIFKTYKESELAEKPERTTTEPIRKLLQIRPQLRHVSLVETELDFADDAANQVDNLQVGVADDPVWDKTFKFRLTSKKTGKKIDLNITYKLESEY